MYDNFRKAIITTLVLLILVILAQASWTYFSIRKLQNEVVGLTGSSQDRECEVVTGKKHIYKGECLPEDYQAKMLTRLSPRACFLDTIQYLDVRAKIAVERLIQDAQEDGMCLVITSGYRSREEQKKLRNNEKSQTEPIAKPGRSEHQTGLAVDFGGCPMRNGKRDDSVERLELEKSFKDLPEYKWLNENAHKYDFYQSYRKINEDRTGYSPEPWHWKLIVP